MFGIRILLLSALLAGTAWAGDDVVGPKDTSTRAKNVLPLNRECERLLENDATLSDRFDDYVAKLKAFFVKPRSPEERRAGFSFIRGEGQPAAVKPAAPAQPPIIYSSNGLTEGAWLTQDHYDLIMYLLSTFRLEGSLTRGFSTDRTSDSGPVFLSARVWKIYNRAVSMSQRDPRGTKLDKYLSYLWFEKAIEEAELFDSRELTVEAFKLAVAEVQPFSHRRLYFTNLIQAAAQRVDTEPQAGLPQSSPGGSQER